MSVYGLSFTLHSSIIVIVILNAKISLLFSHVKPIVKIILLFANC